MNRSDESRHPFFWPNLWKEALNFHCSFNISCRFFWWDICYHLSSHTSYQDCQYKCWHTCLRNAGTPEGSFPSSTDIRQPPGIYGRHMQMSSVMIALHTFPENFLISFLLNQTICEANQNICQMNNRVLASWTHGSALGGWGRDIFSWIVPRGL